ncbi:MAG: ribosome biogenesis GTP-binding protein YihA/YsxC [Marinilabiliaceae bacterium]|jgi:GTP-binding protein|nr:ribosome biogenesis GTP-binding protein YihA/YsxC [Marinilabiliaceae bacterium]
MIINTASFVKSSARLSQCPEPEMPEYAFIGRSNVGKSSLINMLTGRTKLAKTSSTPGKTQTINHFLINDSWYLADLPGYGYAKVSKKMRAEWKQLIHNYILKRENLMNLFVLIDSRHKPLESDLEFIHFLGTNHVPLSLVFTKSDKRKNNSLKVVLESYENVLGESWEELPPMFISSTEEKRGREEILAYIEKTLRYFEKA